MTTGPVGAVDLRPMESCLLQDLLLVLGQWEQTTGVGHVFYKGDERRKDNEHTGHHT
jgi:hypothetical protein